MRSLHRNRLREVRAARGLSQVALAADARLTRQSVGAIEVGRAMPAVDVALRLARALDCRVEDLFGAGASEARVGAEPSSPIAPQGRVALAHIGGRWVCHPMERDGARVSADAIVDRSRRGRAEVEPVRSLADARSNVVVMGCAPALGLLADRLNASTGGPGRFLWLSRSSTTALEALSRQHTHVAGVHLVDGKTGEPNVVDVRRHAGTGALVLVTLARWEAGLVVARGNPRKIRSAADLARKQLRLVTREPGSGARRLLDRELRREGVGLARAESSRIEASGHLEVASAIASGAADVGVATRDAAIVLGLDFVPLVEERYDLVLPRASLADPRIERLLDMLTAATLRRELAALGYDVRSAGDRVAEIDAA